MSEQRGFSVINFLVTVVILGLIGGTGWYVWQTKNKTNHTLSNTAKSSSEPQKVDQNAPAKAVPDPTADWVTYTNTDGVYTFKHPASWVMAVSPELCTKGLILFGGNASSVGACGSDNGGQIGIYSSDGDQRASNALDKAGFKDIKKTDVLVDTVKGERSEGVSQSTQSNAGLGLPDGTKVVTYVFYTKTNKTYVATYTQRANYPDVLADFDTMVTKTLKFSL